MSIYVVTYNYEEFWNVEGTYDSMSLAEDHLRKEKGYKKDWLYISVCVLNETKGE